MSHNITQDNVGNPTLDQQHQILKHIFKHLRYASTSDAPEEVREHLRRVEIAKQRHDRQVDVTKN